MVTRETDAVQHLLVADTHDNLLFFTQRGRVFQLRCHDVPEARRTARGIPIINIISIEQNELVTAVVAVTRHSEGDYMILATKQGEIKRTALKEFESVRSNGLIAMDLEEGDELVRAAIAKEDDDVIIVSELGQSIRFAVKPLRTASRASGGVRAIRLTEDDQVTGMEIVVPDSDLLLVTENGYGKRVAFGQYPRQGRGGSGVRTLDAKARLQTGRIMATRVVNTTNEVMIISNDGIVLRTTVDSISRQGRATRGVTVMRLGNGDHVAAIARLDGDAASVGVNHKEDKPRGAKKTNSSRKSNKPAN
jgi:DNA gyrase subunit A